MAGLDRKVPNKPEDYKASGALKSCIYRSFITSFGVASHSWEHVADISALCSRFFRLKNRVAFGRFREKVYICTVKPITRQDNEGIFI